MSDIEPCPKCGALPCDWVENPHLSSGEQGWRLIETAPKDGSGVILIDMNAQTPEAGKGWFKFDIWTAVEPIGALALDRDVFHAIEWVAPTHWMPLPPPPIKENKG